MEFLSVLVHVMDIFCKLASILTGYGDSRVKAQIFGSHLILKCLNLDLQDLRIFRITSFRITSSLLQSCFKYQAILQFNLA